MFVKPLYRQYQKHTMIISNIFIFCCLKFTNGNFDGGVTVVAKSVLVPLRELPKPVGKVSINVYDNF